MEKKLVLENYPTLGDFIVAVFLAGRTLQCKKDATGWHEVKHYGSINLNTFNPANEIKGEWRAKPEKRTVEGWILVSENLSPPSNNYLPWYASSYVYTDRAKMPSEEMVRDCVVAKITFEVEE